MSWANHSVGVTKMEEPQEKQPGTPASRNCFVSGVIGFNVSFIAIVVIQRWICLLIQRKEKPGIK